MSDEVLATIGFWAGVAFYLMCVFVMGIVLRYTGVI